MIIDSAVRSAEPASTEAMHRCSYSDSMFLSKIGVFLEYPVVAALAVLKWLP